MAGRFVGGQRANDFDFAPGLFPYRIGQRCYTLLGYRW